MIPLTKTLDPSDYEDLHEELVIVDQHFGSAREQNPARRWEYAMALRALKCWGKSPHYIVDVGGDGSPFWRMLPEGPEITIVDPACGQSLQEYLSTWGLEHDEYEPILSDAVFCLSVLEHVEDLDQFLYHLACLTAPGGLLFLTMDCWNKPGQKDTAHFHWMRKRIFNTASWFDLADEFAPWEFSLLGECDWAYHGHQLFDSYSFASLALVKQP